MNDNNKNRLAAAIITLLLLAGALWVILSTYLRYEYPPRDAELLTQLQQDSILFGGEFVMLGDNLEPQESEQTQEESPEEAEQVEPEPKVEGHDLTDNGEPAKQAKPLVTTKEESPMKEKEKPKPKEEPKKTGPAKETPKTNDKQEKVKQNPEAAKKPDPLAGKFGNGNKNTGGKQGNPNGNAAQGDITGKPGTEGLVGYTLERWGRPHSKWTGSVKLRVRVSARGNITEAVVVGGKGEAYSHKEVRDYCVRETLKSAFSVPKNTSTEAVGYVTWNFI